MENINSNENEEWFLFMSEIKKKAKEKFGSGYQKKISEKMNLNKNRVSRFFKIKKPNFETVFIIIKALDLELNLKKIRKKI